MKAVSARNLSKTYWYHEKQEGLKGSIESLFRGKKIFVEALRGIDIDLEVGETIGFIGPNGAGKTTTLKMLSGILYPTKGRLEVMGFIPFNREKAFLKQITFISGQRNQLFWDLPAEEYFNFCHVVYEIPEEVYRRNLRLLVDLADISDILEIPQRKLSIGQRKRCELVAAFLHDPKVIFLDEPTNALDLINAKRIREFIREKGKEGTCTIILTSHNLSDIEQVCERIVIINVGKIVFDGSIRDLNRLDGFKRRIRVLFKERWKLEEIEKLGEIKERDDLGVLLEVESNRAASVASYLFSKFPVQDIGITDFPLEKIIESLYLRNKIEVNP
jgi:ABC-2 type transport system ATP-binding protein